MNSKTFIIGDIHGAHKALKQCLMRAEFDYKNDRLICLGDVCDGYPDTKECIEELMEIKNLIYILGNHDKWSLDWMLTDEGNYTWFSQGGKWTMHSYHDGIPQSHIDFLNNALDYHIENNVLYVHGGFNPNKPITENTQDDFLWDRKLFSEGLENTFDKVYVGHTSINEVTTRGNVTCIDTGAGHGGRITMMDIESGKIYKSDKTKNMYVNHQPRG